MVSKYRKGVNMKVIKNSDKELVHEIETKLKQNGGYCPC